jgi:predicted sulfurtransferase
MFRLAAASRRTALPALLALAGLVAPGLAARAAEAEKFGLLTAAQLHGMLGAPDLKVFDANSDESYAAGHVPGAVHLADYRKFPASVLPADKATRVIFYCTNSH